MAGIPTIHTLRELQGTVSTSEKKIVALEAQAKEAWKAVTDAKNEITNFIDSFYSDGAVHLDPVHTIAASKKIEEVRDKQRQAEKKVTRLLAEMQLADQFQKSSEDDSRSRTCCCGFNRRWCRFSEVLDLLLRFQIQLRSLL